MNLMAAVRFDRSLLPGMLERRSGVILHIAALLRDHVTLKCRSIDRIFLQAYVPKLQSVGQVCIFLRWQRKFKFPRRRPLGRIGEAYGPPPAGRDD